MRLPDTLDIGMTEEVLLLEERKKVKSVISTDSLPKFEHINAETIEEAVRLLEIYGERAAVIAGGMDLLRELNARAQPTQPKILINIKSITQPSLSYIKEDTAALKIGSLATLHDIETNELIKKKYSILAQAAHGVGTPQCRNRATIGGNLCQHVKCWYYRASGNTFFCYRKGGNKCYAVDGDNRYHAIFGGGDCFAVCPSDTAPALIALGAKVKIVRASAERMVPLEKFFTLLGNTLKPGEIITEIQIPIPKPDSRGIFLKFRLRNALDPALASVAVMGALEDGVCRSIKIVLGAVSSIPRTTVKAEEILVGEEISEDRAESAAQAAIEGATPLSMNAYKVDIVKALVKHAILELM